jgi:hypothetical protein
MSIKTTGVTAQFRIDAAQLEEISRRDRNSKVAGGHDDECCNIARSRKGKSEHAFFVEAKITVMADHDMVEHTHAHDVAHVFQPLGDIDVLGARRWIAARMIVHEDDAGGGFPNNRVVDLARMDQRRGERSLGDLDLAHFAVFVV